MTTISQFQCPVCMLSSSPKTFVDRTLLDPADFGRITVRECRGRKGLPIIEQTAFINKKEEYPEVYDRLKDVCLGLINAFYNHNLIKPTDLPIGKELDLRDEQIMTLEDDKKDFDKKLQAIKDTYDEKIIGMEEKHKIKIDTHDEALMEKSNYNKSEVSRLKQKVNQMVANANNQKDEITQYYENKMESYQESNQQLRNYVEQLKEQLRDMQVESGY